MSADCSVFLSLKSEKHAIRIANRSVIYSEGIGVVRFLSSCGFYIVIHGVLFVPSLTASLFASNRFAWEHCEDYMETLEFPLRRWVNRWTGATEFTATIRSNDLAYLNWKPAPQNESANVSIAELHAHLNHLPLPAVRSLVHNNLVIGLPDRIDNNTNMDVFCEDCINGKLTRAPHTTLAA